MEQKNSENDKDNKDTDKKDSLQNIDSKEKKEDQKDNSTKPNYNEEEKNEKENLINDILNIDKEKEIKNQKEESEEKIQPKKKERNEVPIREWPCRTLKEYKIINNPIGSGSYGTVFKAYHIGSEKYAKEHGIPKIVALKKIKTENETEGFPITALREILVMKIFNHKNILQLLEVVYDIKKEDNQTKYDIYLVFEYMEHDLCTIITNRIKYELSHIKFIFNELVLGLEYLHKSGVLHRDLKPSNILLNNKGGVKIGDFGLARFFSNVAKKKYTNQVVTVCYRAPELLLGENNYLTEIDIWSLGCILLELFTGNIVFWANNDKDVFTLICQLCGTPDETNWPTVTSMKNYTALIPKVKYESKLDKKYYPNIDEVTLDLIKKMLTLNPKKRITLEEIKNHPYLTTHEPKMCKAEDMPKIEEEMHYLQYKNKMEKKNQEQKIGIGEYKKSERSFIGKKRKK